MTSNNSSDDTRGLPHSESFLRSLVWQDTRLDLMRDVLAHPDHKPSLTELFYVNEFNDEAEIRRQLSLLVEYGILERVEYTQPDASDSLPTVFYTLTSDGWSVVRYFNEQFSPEIYERLSEMYERTIDEAPNVVQESESAPRPTGTSSGE